MKNIMINVPFLVKHILEHQLVIVEPEKSRSPATWILSKFILSAVLFITWPGDHSFLLSGIGSSPQLGCFHSEQPPGALGPFP